MITSFSPTGLGRTRGGGVSSLANVLGTILDLEMLQGFELQGAKRNAQLLLQILQPQEKEEEVAEPSAFGDDEDIQNLSEEERDLRQKSRARSRPNG